eukprot:4463915-Pyramimonas_sp.AAC.1
MGRNLPLGLQPKTTDKRFGDDGQTGPGGMEEGQELEEEGGRTRMRSLRFAVGIWGAMVEPSLPGIEQSLRLTNIAVSTCGSPKEPCMARIKTAKTK